MPINRFSRYQVGLTLNDIFPSINGFCACGCGNPLPKNKRKWYSNDCRDASFMKFAIIKGDINIIRRQLYEIDFGGCRKCGIISNSWEADHIIPVSEGGGGCTISNYQTLCLECHKQKTYNLINLPTTRLFLHTHLRPFSNVILLQSDKLRIVV